MTSSSFELNFRGGGEPRDLPARAKPRAYDFGAQTASRLVVALSGCGHKNLDRATALQLLERRPYGKMEGKVTSTPGFSFGPGDSDALSAFH